MSDMQDELVRAQTEIARKQARWEVPKALAMIATGCAVFMGFVLAAANFLHPLPPVPQQITVHLDAPLTIQPTR